MDATANEVEGVIIEGFPTIKFYPAKNKTPAVDYDGDRTEEKLYEFLKAQSSLEFVESVKKEEL